MDLYVILGGGYWQESRKPAMGGYQVDPDDNENKATVDYIIKINGLPNVFFQPTEVVRKYRYYCNTCKRWVKEIEVEHNMGCVVMKEHDVVMEYRDVPIWETGAVDAYAIARQKWMKPCFRIMLNHSKGMAKWEDIWRYIDGTLPVTTQRRDKLPAAVGDRRQWTMLEAEVPVIKLAYEAAKDPDPAVPVFDPEWKRIEFQRQGQTAGTVKNDEEDNILCQICGAKVKGKRGLFAHMKQAHKINIHSEKDEENNGS